MKRGAGECSAQCVSFGRGAAARNARAFSHDPTVPVDFTDCSGDGPLVNNVKQLGFSHIVNSDAEFWTNSHSWRSKIKCNLSSLLLTHKHSCHTHPRINAHAHHKRFSARLLRKNSQPSRLMKRKKRIRTTTQRMPNGNRPPFKLTFSWGIFK